MHVRRFAMRPLVLVLAALPWAVAAPQHADAAKKRETRSERKTEKGGAPAGAPGGGQATLVETYADWSAYTAQTGRAKICYALSQPKLRTPSNLKDTPAYVFISFRPADGVRNEVASVLNFDTKDGAPATLVIGNVNYDLVTKGKNAWVKNPSEELLAIGTMTKSKTMTLQVTSARGNKTSDRYSLSGFQQALDRAKRECP